MEGMIKVDFFSFKIPRGGGGNLKLVLTYPPPSPRHVEPSLNVSPGTLKPVLRYPRGNLKLGEVT